MRIAILTHCEERHYYFANQIIAKTSNVVGVITGAKRVNPNFYKKIKHTLRMKEVKYLFKNNILNLLFRPYCLQLAKEKRLEELSLFGGSRDSFLKNYQHLFLAHVGSPHASVNDTYYTELIRQARPDVIVVMGTCLLTESIIESAPWVINLHTGLSPYYRGGGTNLWPIIKNEYGYFGVTIHKMSLGIDSGDIIYTAFPEIYPDDNYGRINSRCIVLGTNLMIKTIEHIAKGDMKAVKQWTKGKLFFDRNMNGYIAYKYFKKKKYFIDEYLRLKRKNQLPEVRVISNGD